MAPVASRTHADVGSALASPRRVVFRTAALDGPAHRWLARLLEGGIKVDAIVLVRVLVVSIVVSPSRTKLLTQLQDRYDRLLEGGGNVDAIAMVHLLVTRSS